MRFNKNTSLAVPGGDQYAAGAAARVGAEAGGIRGPAEGTGGTGAEDAAGVSGPAGRVRGEIETATGRQRSADEGHHKQVGVCNQGTGRQKRPEHSDWLITLSTSSSQPVHKLA